VPRCHVYRVADSTGNAALESLKRSYFLVSAFAVPYLMVK
jgi:hypothetical protein